MSSEITKEYSNGELTIVWRAGLCKHSGECVRRLPRVYNPRSKPWIKIENANTADLIEQINHCPSAALSYYINKNEG